MYRVCVFVVVVFIVIIFVVVCLIIFSGPLAESRQLVPGAKPHNGDLLEDALQSPLALRKSTFLHL